MLKIEDVEVGRWLEGKEGKRRDERWGESWGGFVPQGSFVPNSFSVERRNGQDEWSVMKNRHFVPLE